MQIVQGYVYDLYTIFHIYSYSNLLVISMKPAGSVIRNALFR
jgi:hypothetical protein